MRPVAGLSHVDRCHGRGRGGRRNRSGADRMQLIEKMLTLPCDVLVPAAVERVTDAKLAGELRCRILAEGANTPEADQILEKASG